LTQGTILQNPFFSPADYRIYLFVCSYIREMKIQMQKEDMHMIYDQFVHSSLYDFQQSKGTRFIYCISIFIFIFLLFSLGVKAQF